MHAPLAWLMFIQTRVIKASTRRLFGFMAHGPQLKAKQISVIPETSDDAGQPCPTLLAVTPR